MTLKIFLLLASFCTLSQAIEFGAQAPNSTNKKYLYETKFYNQRIDHFNFLRNDFYKQRYLVNDTFWDTSREGPIFFYTGNEGDIEAFAQNSGFIWDIAPFFNAMVIFAEHRYYGRSLPYGNKSLTPDPNFNGFLTSEQALADYACLLHYIKTEVKGAKNSPVIAFGGSYGGMLAAWFRVKYPHIVAGAIAASAPVSQFDAPCDAFGRIVTSDYTAQGKFCSDTIRLSWAAIDSVTAGLTADGMAWFNNNFKFCTPLTTADQVTKFKAYLNDLWTNIAMMNYPYETTFLMPLPGNPVNEACQRIEKALSKHFNETTAPKTVLEAIQAGVDMYNNYTGKAKCLELGEPDQIGADMWDYQACTEMIMPMCFDGIADMFEKAPWNETEVIEICQAKWKVKPRVKMADIMYGARELHGASNIIFSNGLLDPWSSGGILRSVSKSVIALLIPEGAHHLDLRGANEKDPQSVREARQIERKFIKKWIDQYHKQQPSGGHDDTVDPIIVG